MFYDKLQNACQRKDIKITPLTTKLGISKGNISNWKNGGRPSIDVLLQIAQEVECSVAYLLEETDNPTPISKKRKPTAPRARKLYCAGGVEGHRAIGGGWDTLAARRGGDRRIHPEQRRFVEETH